WIYYRFKFVFQNRKLLNLSNIFDQPIQVFHSRHGFNLSHLIEYVIYDEIFVDRCYEFASFRETVQHNPEGLVLDFGVHHGMFMSYLQSLQHRGKIFGAELNPPTYAKACKRLAAQKNVTLLNVGIGGYARNVSIGQTAISTQQSIYSEESEKSIQVPVITPADFVAKNNLIGKKITVLKMDIEGAEKEIFERFESIQDILANTRLFIIEIHDPADVPVITNRLESVGLRFRENRSINFFFSRPD
ncbi:MAG: FkbM family methyltransferase, partial [Verrucomicrobiota bacterium]